MHDGSPEALHPPLGRTSSRWQMSIEKKTDFGSISQCDRSLSLHVQVMDCLYDEVPRSRHPQFGGATSRQGITMAAAAKKIISKYQILLHVILLRQNLRILLLSCREYRTEISTRGRCLRSVGRRCFPKSTRRKPYNARFVDASIESIGGGQIAVRFRATSIFLKQPNMASLVPICARIVGAKRVSRVSSRCHGRRNAFSRQVGSRLSQPDR